jgi:hypothetical protein
MHPLPPAISESMTVGVGTPPKEPPSVALVRGADVSRSKDSVAPGISSRHKVPNDDVASLGSDAWAVFEKHPGRSNSVNCTHDLAIEARLFARYADALACG